MEMTFVIIFLSKLIAVGTNMYTCMYIVKWFLNIHYSLFGDSENRENNYLKIRDLLSIALFNILGTHYLIHI